MELDRNGRLVVAGPSTVLYQKADTDLAPIPGCPPGPISQVLAGRTGSLFVASDSIIHERLFDGRWIRYGAEEGLDFLPGPLQVDGEGNLWVVNGNHLAVKPAGNDRFEDRSAWMPGAHYSGASASAGQDGSVWIPTLEGALRVRGSSREVLGPREGMPSRHIQGVFQDREKSLWLFASSLYRQLGQGCVTAYTQQEGLPSDVVWSVFQDRAGTLFAGTGDGLARLGAKGWERIRGSEGMSILSIDQDPAGNLWLANLNGPPAILGTGGRLSTLAGFEVSGRAMRVSTDGDGHAWFSLLGGQNMMRYDSKTQRLTPIMDIYPGVQTIGPRALYTDARGRIWIAGNSGIACLEDSRWRFLTPAGGLRNAKVRGLAFMDDGSAWAWYVEPNGITHLDLKDGRLVVLGHLDLATGLTSNLVYAAGQGKDQALWITTDRGVNRLQNGEFRRFGIEEGLPTEDCNLNAFTVDRDGGVWVGTSNGITRIRADQLPELRPVPAPRILRYDDGKESHLAPFGTIPPIPHPFASIEFRFATPTYLDERNLRYEVRLVGLEDDWHPTEVQQARYPALQGGRFRFEVRVARAGSPFGPATTLNLEVLPAWWHTWWFYGFELLMGIGLVALLVSWRVRKLQAAKTALAALVAERTIELEKANQALADSNLALKEQSLSDPLTGLRNRRFLSLGIKEDLARVLRVNREYLPDASRENIDLVFLLVDLDKFKAVNDTYGHPAGDAVLIQMAEVLRGVMRDSDTIVRWGGEEFLLLARDTSRTEAMRVAERVRTAVEAHSFLIEGNLVLRCTCSIGFAAYPFMEHFPTWASWEKIVDLADHGLYLVKGSGRNGWLGFQAGPALNPDQDFSTLETRIPQAVQEGLLILQQSRPFSLSDQADE
ncbi:MAG: diguanylate cyclase [Acidobacteriota bacterium]|nr:diguanylate cyclase [Acidobacteriota bacterium]